MWNAEELFNFLKMNPNGGTFWKRSKKTIYYIRTFYPDKQTVVAVMTEKMIFRGKDDSKVRLFAASGKGMAVEEFFHPRKNQEFMETLLASDILNLVSADFLPAVKKFIATPDKTYYYTW
jgi:hypothetical protein